MNLKDFQPLQDKYRRSGLLIDANLLLLLLVGSYDQSRISQFKKTAKYTVEDFELLQLLIEPFERLVTTPHILTEVNNLSGEAEGRFPSAYFALFAQIVFNAFEIYVPGNHIAQTVAFFQYGITDAGIIEAARNKYLILTDDLRLYRHLASSQIDAVNFTRFREFYLFDE